MKKEYNLDFASNNTSNDFLRCLWSRLRTNFGKTAWNLTPIKLGEKKLIHIGYLDLGPQANNSTVTSISCTYSKKGCLKSLIYDNKNLVNPESFEQIFDKSIEEAKNFKNHLKVSELNVLLDRNMKFDFTKGKNFKLVDHELTFRYSYYDKEDAKTYSLSTIKLITALLSFDSLNFVGLGESGMENLRKQNKSTYYIKNIDSKEEEWSSMCSNDKFQGIAISKYIIDYIDEFLERKMNYENTYNNFEKSILTFKQALFFEEIAKTQFKLDLSLEEYATTSFMSALEIITLNDIELSKCRECGQDRYSIAKRLITLAENATNNNENVKKIIKNFYALRSKFVHTGRYMSTSNYTGTSSPLLSETDNDGIINQTYHFNPDFKKMIKNCILWHEKLLPSQID